MDEYRKHYTKWGTPVAVLFRKGRPIRGYGTFGHVDLKDIKLEVQPNTFSLRGLGFRLRSMVGYLLSFAPPFRKKPSIKR